MAQLIKQINNFGSYNNIYQIDIPNFLGVKNSQLVPCYILGHNKEIQITDILVESVNKNTGYNVQWQSCVRYDSEDFQNSYPNVKDFLSQYDNNKFAGWCIIFKIDNVEYGLTGKVDSDEIRLNCYREIKEDVLKYKVLFKSSLYFFACIEEKIQILSPH